MSDTMLLFAGLLASGAVFLVVGPFVFREIRRARAFDGRLAAFRREAAALAPGPALSNRARRGGPSLRNLGLALLRAVSMLVPVGAAEREKLAQMLRQAGFAKADALPLFLSLKLFVALALAALAAALTARTEALGQHGLLVAFAAVAGLVVGSIAAEYGLQAMVARRLRRMSAALPDALDLMMMCLDCGLTFERSLATVAVQLMPIERGLADEFRLIEAELRLASDRRAVLQDYYRRTRVDGLRDLAMTLIQSDRYGTPLSQSVRNIASSERLQRSARITAQTERLPVLMTLPTLLFVVPGTMLLVGGPAFLAALEALGSLGGM